jgi:hypothetical protein
MNKKTRPKFVILKSRETGSIEDICRIERKSTGVMDPRQFFWHNLNARLNPFYSGEISYESISTGARYDPSTARRFYNSVRV